MLIKIKEDSVAEVNEVFFNVDVDATYITIAAETVIVDKTTIIELAKHIIAFYE